VKLRRRPRLPPDVTRVFTLQAHRLGKRVQDGGNAAFDIFHNRNASAFEP
jgi:hypothetical protein